MIHCSFAVCVLGVLTASVYSPDAVGHAVLLGSSPQADQVLDEAPQEVVLNFNENVGPIFIKLLDLSGAEVGSPGDWRVDGNDVHMPLGDLLDDGTYILTYRVISADTHPVGSTLVFAIGEAMKDASSVALSDQGSTGWTYVVALNRLLLYASMLLAAGSALLILLMNLPTAAQGRLAAVLAALAYVLAMGLGGAEMVMGGAGALFSVDAWAQAARSTLLPSVVIGVPGVAILWYAFRPNAASRSTALLLAGAALAIGGFLVTGHAATAPPVWLMAVMVAVHLACVAFWFGALRPLWLTTRTASIQEAGAVMSAFSQRAVWSVSALFVSGAVITWVQVETPANMIGTDYGLRLSLKLILFLLLLGLATLNKIRLTPKLAAGDATAAASLRRSITIEYGLVVLILIAAVSLTLPSPPRALIAQSGVAGATGGAVEARGENRGYVVRIEVSPGSPGQNMVMLRFEDSEGKPVEMQRVDTVWSLPAAGLEGIERTTERVAPDMFHLMSNDLILPGEWNVRVGAYVDDFDKTNISATVTIR